MIACAAKVSTRLMGAEANTVLSKTVGVVALREGSTGNTVWTSEIPKGVPVMEHDTVCKEVLHGFLHP